MHRGGQFLRRRDGEPVTMPLEPGDGCVVPPRWPHWLEHPGETPAVSFDVGYWTSAAIRERKVYDVNWLMRRAHLTPTPPGISGRRDALKLHAFDLVSRVTGKGAEYRGR